ncbi:DUF2834 domain-containing protein [Tranquillimonas alkanivorans]|uniref:K+-transporting ATPase, A chain n=1 Tax=Tranquillimonas alkanivorans TaxID=441119 RepID=A0A1I5KV59_9RHOB|nr:DUF2834 domain-containing protein [Tranquillimonas alkanivorans]SFO88818.1 Protein of unknown function [Tranquillimonas alkanivorans]
MRRLRWLFLALAAWGAVHPLWWFTAWLRANDWDWGGMIDAWYANASVTGLTWDLTISAIAFTVWAVAESVISRDWTRLVAVPVTVLIGLSCALPLYLFLRLRRD